jgi:hypothetical protein
MENNAESLEHLQLTKGEELYASVDLFLKENKGGVNRLKLTLISGEDVKVRISLPVSITSTITETDEAGGTASTTIAKYKQMLFSDKNNAKFEGDIVKKYIIRKNNKKNSLDLLATTIGEHINVFPRHSYSKDCAGCNRSGRVVCTACGGACSSTCNRCYGGGRQSCTSCYGSGTVTKQETVHDYSGSNIPSTYITVNETCNSCYGSGQTNCTSCFGSGRITCSYCHGSGQVTHQACSGYGYFTHYGRVSLSTTINNFSIKLNNPRCIEEIKRTVKAVGMPFLIKNCNIEYEGYTSNNENQTVTFNYSFSVKAIEYAVEYDNQKTRQVYLHNLGWVYQLSCLNHIFDSIVNSKHVDNNKKQESLYKEMMEYKFIKDYYQHLLESRYSKNKESTESFLKRNSSTVLIGDNTVNKLRNIINNNIRHIAPSTNIPAMFISFIPISIVILYIEFLFIYGDQYTIKMLSTFNGIRSSGYIIELTEVLLIAVIVTLAILPIAAIYHKAVIKKKTKRLSKDMAGITEVNQKKLGKTLLLSAIVEVYLGGIIFFLLQYFTGNKILTIDNEKSIMLLNKIHIHLFGLNNFLLKCFNIIHTHPLATLVFFVITLTVPSLVNYLIEGYNKKVWILLPVVIILAVFIPSAFPMLVLAVAAGSMYIKHNS